MTKIIKIKNMLNAHESIKLGEVNTMPSLTKPDQSMTIREILDRYANGQPLTGQRVPMFDEGNDLPDPRTLDYAELDELASNFRSELKTIREKAEEIRAKNEALLREQRAEEEAMRKKFRETYSQQVNPVDEKPVKPA